MHSSVAWVEMDEGLFHVTLRPGKCLLENIALPFIVRSIFKSEYFFSILHSVSIFPTAPVIAMVTNKQTKKFQGKLSCELSV